MVVDVRIDRLRVTYRPHLVQFILIRSIVEVIAEDGIEYILVRFRQIVSQIQVVDETECGRFIFDTFLDAVDGAVAQIESLVRFEAAVILTVLIEVVDAPFGVLVVELRTQEILSPQGMGRVGKLEVHHATRFAATQDNIDYGTQFVVTVLLARVFDELHAQHVFGSDGGYFLVRHFDAVDSGLHFSTTADAHAVGELVHLQAGDAEVVQQIVGTERTFQLALGGQDNLTVHALKYVAGGYGHFTQAYGIFLQLYIAQVEVVVQFQ